MTCRMTARELSIGVRWRIPVILAVTVFVNYLDRNNLALALPRIAQEFGWSDRVLMQFGAQESCWLLQLHP